MRVSFALRALLLALAAAAVAARFTIDICETYSKEDCLEHSDKCTVCRAWDKLDVCFETSIAKKLPTKLFECDFPSPSPPPAEPDTDCQDRRDEASCEATSGCVWCLSAAVPSACYTEAEARRLPAAVFQCKFPNSLA